MIKKFTIQVLICTILIAPFLMTFQAEEKRLDIQNANEIQHQAFNDSPIIWTKTFGGRGSEICYSMDTTRDGGCILVGETTSFGSGGSDVWLVKVDRNGQEEWNKTYGSSHGDYAVDGHQTSDNGFILVGGTTSYGAGDHDTWLIKTDQTGNELWNMTFGGPDRDQGYAVKQVSDGGFIICGGTKSYGKGPNDYWVIRTDQNGHELWNITYGTKGYDWGYDIIETSDNGFIFTGGTDTSITGTHILDIGLIKVNKDGVLQWEKFFNKPPVEKRWDEGYGVIQTVDGGYIIAGIAHTYGWDENSNGAGWIIKTDAKGNKQWDKTYGGGNCDCLCSIRITSDGGYILSGWTYTYGKGDADMWIMKTDAQGIDQWDITLGGDKFDCSMFHTIQQTADQYYLIAGYTESIGSGSSDIILVKLGEPLITIAGNGQNGFSWTVKNGGEDDLEDVNWSISLDGLHFMGSDRSGTIDLLPAGGEITLRVGGMVLGFGPMSIRVTVGGIGKTLNCFLLGPFVIKG
ncbi:Uncharacterised protein [uncultured archaeon]|nr:Uncharacterised protein [uncultured archaeon]